jgi:hypothetical protein
MTTSGKNERPAKALFEIPDDITCLKCAARAKVVLLNQEFPSNQAGVAGN